MRAIILYSSLLILLNSCYTANLIQTAKSLEKGEHQITTGLVGNSLFHQDDYNGDFLPGMILMYRTGVFKHADIGFTYAPSLVIGDVRADMKYNFFRTNNTYLSAILSAELVSPLDFPNFGDEFSSFSSGLGFIASFNHSNKLHPFVYQKYTMGLSGLGALSNFKNEEPLDYYAVYSHKMYYVGGVGLKYSFKQNGRVQLVFDFSYYASREMRYSNYEVFQENDKVFNQFRRIERYMNYQTSFGMSFGFGKRFNEKEEGL
jgi:hypothetical protein